jgi:hypothetical protein
MGRKRTRASRKRDDQNEGAILAALIEKRRLRGSAFMRQWRADPENRDTERRRRYEEYASKKLRIAERLRLHPYTGAHGQLLCGLCGLARPVEIVERLRISRGPSEEYVKVSVPYCGRC